MGHVLCFCAFPARDRRGVLEMGDTAKSIWETTDESGGCESQVGEYDCAGGKFTGVVGEFDAPDV